MKKSPLYDILPPGKVPGVYAGWKTALSFGDPETEFRAAVDGTAVTDRSMCGRIEVTGEDRLDLLHRLSTNSLAGLPAGKVLSTVFVTDRGRVIDTVIVCPRESSLLLITSPGAEQFLIRWIEKYTITEDIMLSSVTDDTVMVSLIGPRMISMVCTKLGFHLGENTSAIFQHEGTNVYAVRVSNSSSDIAHMVAPNASAAHLAEITGSLPGARWIGCRAYEGFRITRGIPASPGEFNDAHNPLESGLRDSVSFTKGCYIGQEVIARLDTYGKIRRRLARVASPEAIPGPLPTPLWKNGIEAGMLTSISEIPFGGQFPGLAIVRNDIAAPGDKLDAGASGARVLVADTFSEA